MSIAEALRISPGTVIKTYKPKETRRTVVGNPRQGLIPIGVSENGNGSNVSYTVLRPETIDRLTHERGTKVESKEPSIQEKNIIKLWNCDLLWDQQSTTAKLKEGVILWATFDNNEQILDLSPEKPEDKSPPMSHNGTKLPELSLGQPQLPPLKLQVTDNHLYICMNHRVPPTISYQIDVLNWLLVP